MKDLTGFKNLSGLYLALIEAASHAFFAWIQRIAGKSSQ